MIKHFYSFSLTNTAILDFPLACSGVDVVGLPGLVSSEEVELGASSATFTIIL